MSVYIYTVVTTAGPAFECKELEDAISFADILHGEGKEVSVVDSKTGDTVYKAGS